MGNESSDHSAWRSALARKTCPPAGWRSTKHLLRMKTRDPSVHLTTSERISEKWGIIYNCKSTTKFIHNSNHQIILILWIKNNIYMRLYETPMLCNINNGSQGCLLNPKRKLHFNLWQDSNGNDISIISTKHFIEIGNEIIQLFLTTKIQKAREKCRWNR